MKRGPNPRVRTYIATVPVYIYALCEPDTGEVRYVGRSICVPARAVCHFGCGSASNPRVCDLVKSLGRNPAVAILETVLPGDNPDEREKVWMSRFQRSRLLNMRGFADRGETPTYKAIMTIVGVGSTNAVHDALRGLERLGLVILAGSPHRRMRITTKGLSRLGYRTCPCCGSMTRNGFVGGTGDHA